MIQRGRHDVGVAHTQIVRDGRRREQRRGHGFARGDVLADERGKNPVGAVYDCGDFEKVLRADLSKWTQVIRELGLRPE